jgi:chemotaxis protein MotB
MANKPEVEEYKEDSNRWMLSYSDMMSLLLVFFVILLSMSKFNADQVEAVSQSIREGLVGQTAQTSPEAGSFENKDGFPLELPEITPYWSEDDFEEFVRLLKSLIASSSISDAVEIKLDDRGVVISFKDHALFRSGRAELSEASMEVIDKIGELLSQLNYSYVLVEGHTDSDPIKTARYADNMDLSTQRAANVWRRLVAKGIDPKKSASIGYGEYRPIAPNDTSENKAKNRRVVVTILRAQLIASGEFIIYEPPADSGAQQESN